MSGTNWVDVMFVVMGCWMALCFAVLFIYDIVDLFRGGEEAGAGILVWFFTLGGLFLPLLVFLELRDDPTFHRWLSQHR